MFLYAAVLLPSVSDRLQVSVDVGALGKHLELNLNRTDFQIRDEGINNASLFSRTAKHKVYRDHLYNFDIAVILCVNNPIGYFFNRQIFCDGIEIFCFRCLLWVVV